MNYKVGVLVDSDSDIERLKKICLREGYEYDYDSICDAKNTPIMYFDMVDGNLVIKGTSTLDFHELERDKDYTLIGTLYLKGAEFLEIARRYKASK